jgi:hypothetical protein
MEVEVVGGGGPSPEKNEGRFNIEAGPVPGISV